jgi:hypothetical protein
LIQICAYHLGRRKYFSTGIYRTPNQWDLKRLKINDNHYDHEFLNDDIDNTIKRIKAIIRQKK